ncbi:aminotransferase class V-fold PLP-dependent enzyme [Microbacterium sp. 18062]|uniref:aminotransferase class V-fold PLP-dependent enzyme n=1 Tax=Microbacterium sp. 18062 TaxID=2681410 RepID=UPI00135BFE9B|nr:aminotransferase class V-fold PLP-dependent enzyme [Microbacterium sp. 18062]
MTQEFDGIHRSLYPGTQEAPYLDAAAVGIISSDVREAILQITADHEANGIGAWIAGADPQKALAVERLAALVNGSRSSIALTQNTSTGLAIVANGIQWRHGDNIVVPVNEFPSNFYPWTQLRRHGVEIREVPMAEGHALISDFGKLIDDRTRVVAVSAVQYSSGYRYDLRALGDFCRQLDALLVVDGTQALGAMTIDVRASLIDVLVVSAHKWMLGPLGIGFAHFSERALNSLYPSTTGWLSVDRPFDFDHEPKLAVDARRYESGTENAAGIVGISAAVNLVLKAGPAAIESHILHAGAYLAKLLRDLGWRVLNDYGDEHRSGILIASSGRNDAGYHRRLLDNGVRCSLRGGGVRFSPHYFTSSSDLHRVADVVAA